MSEYKAPFAVKDGAILVPASRSASDTHANPSVDTSSTEGNLGERRFNFSTEVKARLRERADNFGRLDKGEDFPKLEIPKLVSLLEKLRDTLTSSAQSLQSDNSPDNVDRVALSVLEKVSALVVQNISIPQTPATSSPARQAVFNTFERLGKLLGRNTAEAIRADTIRRIQQSAELAFQNGEIYGKRNWNGNGLEPSEWITKQVLPHVDSDMVVFVSPESTSFD